MSQSAKSFADTYIPDGVSMPEAQARTSHLAIGAHQDDLEFMAFHGISTCYDMDWPCFGGVTCTDGGGSAREGKYADYSDDDMKAVRIQEQRKAAEIGKYSFVDQLGFSSAEIKTKAGFDALSKKLELALLTTQPDILYTHNPADKHATHVTVFRAVLAAIRRVPPYSRPKKIYGCEVWRDLDWLCDEDKVALDVSGHKDLADKLHACFDSQIAGGKNYGEAVIGRSKANATFHDAHSVDTVDQLWLAIDLTPLAEDEDLRVEEFIEAKIDRFKQAVMDPLKS